MTTYGLTPEGFQIKRLQEVIADLEAHVRSEFGAEVVTGPDTGFGRIIGGFSKEIADCWEVLQAIYSSRYPASAVGVALDEVLDQNGMRRIAEDFSRVWLLLTGDPDTVIPSGSRASHASTAQPFATQAAETLSLVSPNIGLSLLVSGGPHAAGEDFTVTVDGVTFVYTTLLNDTDLAVATALAALIDPGFTITEVDQGLRTFKIAGDHVDRFNLVGKRLRVSGATGSVSNNGSYTIIGAEIDGGDTVVEVAQEIPSDFVSGVLKWNTAAAPLVVGSDTFLVLFGFEYPGSPFPPGSADASDFAFETAFVGEIPDNFTLASVARAHEALALEAGPIEAEPNTVTVIDSPVVGWTGVLNPLAADPGRLIEPDVDARQRRQETVRTGLGPSVPGLYNALRELAGVDAVEIFENLTGVDDADGRPGHSVECVVSGGRDSEIAAVIFSRIAGGITSWGNTVEVVVDSQGNSHNIRFSRAVDVPIWVEVDVVALYAEEDLPALAAAAIAEAIVTFGASYKGGLDVIPQRILGAIMANVPGLSEITVTVGLTSTTAATPIAISAREIAKFDDARVTVTGL